MSPKRYEFHVLSDVHIQQEMAKLADTMAWLHRSILNFLRIIAHHFKLRRHLYPPSIAHPSASHGTKRPPPAAYHSATPVNGGRVVVFIGGGKNWGPSSVFLLDTVGLIWSSFEATGGIGLSGQRCLHTAISVTGVETRDSNDDDQHPEESGAQPTTSVTENAASDDPTSPSTPRERGGKEEAAAPTVQLWGPVVAGAGAVPGSARSAGSEKSAVAAASGKKKPGAKEGSAGSKKKDAVKSETVVGNVVDGSDPDTGGGDPPVFESVLIFGGIVGSAAVSGVSRR